METVWTESCFVNKNDSEIIRSLFKIHAPPGPLTILDSTYNRGQMWKHFPELTDHIFYTMDINPKYKTDFVDDFQIMKDVQSDFYDVVVFDPPHLPEASQNSSTLYEEEYGITKGSGSTRGKLNVSQLFPGFFKQAKRVLNKDGIILVKLCDLVQGRRNQWQHVDLINCAREAGLIPCDMAIKVRSGSVISSKWKNPYHLRKSHSYWIVIRKKNCQRKRVK